MDTSKHNDVSEEILLPLFECEESNEVMCAVIM